ncbi:MAG: hypothetical protein QG655_2864 [Actinomycetota bacterium]|nr:hypothetical protein [Actinomycetota bacterium]
MCSPSAMGGAEAPTYHRKQNGFGNVPVGSPSRNDEGGRTLMRGNQEFAGIRNDDPPTPDGRDHDGLTRRWLQMDFDTPASASAMLVLLARLGSF